MASKATNRFSPEVRTRAVRLVFTDSAASWRQFALPGGFGARRLSARPWAPYLCKALVLVG